VDVKIFRSDCTLSKGVYSMDIRFVVCAHQHQPHSHDHPGGLLSQDTSSCTTLGYALFPQF